MIEEPTRNELRNRIHELERELVSRKADQDRLRRIVSSLDLALSVIDPDKTIAWVNDRILQMFPDRDPVGRLCHRFYELSDEPCENCPADRSFATGDVVRVERYSPAFKRWFDIVSKPIRDASGSIIHVLNVVSDITEKKQAEQRLQESEERFRFLSENMFDVVWIMGMDLRTTYVSPSVQKVLGFTPEERNRQRIEETVTPASLREIQKRIAEELQRDREPEVDLNRSVLIEVEYYRKDGSTVWMENRVQVVRDSDKNITGMFGIARDITERRNAQMDVERRSRERRLLLDTIPVQVWYLSDPDTYGPVNRAHADFLGRHPRDIARKKLAEVLGADADLFIAQNHQAFQTKTPIRMDIWLSNAAGESRLIAMTYTPRVDPQGEVEFVVCAGMDITDQHRTEIALRESEKAYRLIADNMADTIWVMDMNMRFTYVSPSVTRMYGVTVDEVVGQTIDRSLTPESFQEAFVAFQEAMALEASGTADPDRTRVMELEEYRRDGSTIWVESSMSFLRDEDQKPIGIVGASRDVTDRRRAREALRREQMMLARTEGIAHVGSWEWDVATDTVTWSDELFRIFQRDPREGAPSFAEHPALYQPDDMARLRQAVEACVAEGVPYELEGRAIRNDGETRVCVGSGFAEMAPGGRAVRLFGLFQDITERKRAEEEKEAMEAQNRQLQKAESLGRMAGAIAHHFNNQLQAVIGNLELARGELAENSEAGLSIKEAMNAALRAAKVSGQMLTYLGQTVGRRGTIGLSEVCRLALPMIEAGMPRNVMLNTQLPSPGPSVHADENQMEQVLTNLISNASEAMAESGGTIYLSASTVRATDIPLLHRFPVDWQPQADAYACLEVRDDGPGIPAEAVEMLFDPFFSTKFTGRGLGLSVALGIVRAHGGCITVESGCGTRRSEVGGQRREDEGRGTEVGGRRSESLCVSASLRENPVGSVFRVFLPLMEGEVPGPKEKPIVVGDAPQGGGMVLLVEDTEQVRNLGVRMLEHLGWKVIAARDGVEGLEMFREHRDEIRFVLSDLTMPRMDGWATIAALRKIDPAVSIILASGYDEVSVMSADHPERPQVFMGKPYSIEDLRTAIGKVI